MVGRKIMVITKNKNPLYFRKDLKNLFFYINSLRVIYVPIVMQTFKKSQYPHILYTGYIGEKYKY